MQEGTSETIRLSCGLLHEEFANNGEKNKGIFLDACILATDNEITSVEEVLPLLEQIVAQQRSLIIVAKGFSGEALGAFVVNVQRGTLNMACVNAVSEDGSSEEVILNNIVRTFGGRIISDKYGISLHDTDISMLGQARYVEVGNDYTLLSDRFISGSDQGSQELQDQTAQTGQANLSAWKNWKDEPVGHKQAIDALTALRSHTEGFLRQLTETRQEWEHAKARSQQIYDSTTDSARMECEHARTSLTNERDQNIQATQERQEKVNRIMAASEQFSGNALSREGLGSAKSAASFSMTYVESHQKEVVGAIKAKVKAYSEYCNCRIADAERLRNDKLNKARTEQADRDTQAERRFKAKYQNVCDAFSTDISEGFNKSSIHAYQQEIRSSRFNAINYECPSDVPDYVMLGDIALSIPSGTQDEAAVVQAVELETGDVGTQRNNEYIVKIPYAQRLSDGISLLMRYSPAERERVQSQIQPLLMKLFMSFPAGKLEATMIDPL